MIDTGPYVLFRDDSEDRTTVFAEPLRVITAHTKAQFWSGLKDMETAHGQGKWLAGFMSYEAGHLFEDKLAPFAQENRRTPLMGVWRVRWPGRRPCTGRAPAPHRE